MRKLSTKRHNVRRRERWAEDHEWREKEKAANRKRGRERWKNDPEHRAQRLAEPAEPEQRARQRASRRKRMESATYREEINAMARRNYRRRMKDPAARKKHAANVRKYREKKGGAKKHQRHRGMLVLRQKFMCGICGKPLDEKLAEVDHVIPVSKWPAGVPGVDDPANLQAMHRACNRAKRDAIDPDDAAGFLPLVLNEQQEERQ